MAKLIKLDGLKVIRKVLGRSNSRLVRDIIVMLLKGHNDKEICRVYGINYHLYRYYLTNINRELRLQLSKARTMRRDYEHERLMRRTLSMVRRRDAKQWYKLL